MAYTQDQYDTLVNAIAQGVLVVKYSDKEITYRNLSDMYRIKGAMEAELGIGGNKSRKVLAGFSKGLNRSRHWPYTGGCNENY